MFCIEVGTYSIKRVRYGYTVTLPFEFRFHLDQTLTKVDNVSCLEGALYTLCRFGAKHAVPKTMIIPKKYFK